MLAHVDEGGDDIAVANATAIVELDEFAEHTVSRDVMEGDQLRCRICAIIAPHMHVDMVNVHNDNFHRHKASRRAPDTRLVIFTGLPVNLMPVDRLVLMFVLYELLRDGKDQRIIGLKAVSSRDILELFASQNAGLLELRPAFDQAAHVLLEIAVNSPHRLMIERDGLHPSTADKHLLVAFVATNALCKADDAV
ncbi:hypothetical protein FY150_05550 [Agrobacterium tumefaciens]|nr:hypothetical protein FY150_05550 [Agrobacterium tumefaciens]